MNSASNIRRLTGQIGAEISDIDVTRLDDGGVRLIKEAFHQHQVLFLPRQRLNHGDLVSFAGRLGEVRAGGTGHVMHTDNPEVILVETDRGAGSGKYNEIWHSDMSCERQPPSVSVLHAVKLPEIGGDTLFASMYAAYEALSEPLKRLVDGLEALHDGVPAFAPLLMDPQSPSGLERLERMRLEQAQTMHPVVRRHPDTGRKALFVNRTFTTRIMGLSDIESRRLLSLLLEHAEQPRFQARWRWSEGDLAMWDNRCTMHYAVYDYGQAHRIMHRVFLAGDRPRA